MICFVRRWQVTRHRQFSLFSWTTRNISGAKLPRLAWILSKKSSIWGWVKPWATEATITDALLTTVLNGAAAFGNHIPFYVVQHVMYVQRYMQLHIYLSSLYLPTYLYLSIYLSIFLSYYLIYLSCLPCLSCLSYLSYLSLLSFLSIHPIYN
jgi:hypothetical protein